MRRRGLFGCFGADRYRGLEGEEGEGFCGWGCVDRVSEGSAVDGEVYKEMVESSIVPRKRVVF